MNLLTSDSVVYLTLWLLAAFSLATWTVILLKSWLFLRVGRQNRIFARGFWQAGDLDAARQLADQGRGMLASLSRRGFNVLRSPGVEGVLLGRTRQGQMLLDRAMREELQHQQRRLDSGLMLLASVGSTAPFVGLFGTVWGIMLALENITASGSAALEVVAGPIGEALIATAFGIATAVPAVLAYNHGLRQSRRIGVELENFAADFIELHTGC
ncbi:MAG: MotA/TolQ/ExbB proton channel family protein [Gammaproteobacteria bacterium]|jgi:biopolymer transport protein ExbB